MQNQAVRGRLARRVWWQEHVAVIVTSLLLLGVILGLLGPSLYTVWDTRSVPMRSERGTVESYSGNNVLVRLQTTSVTYRNAGVLRPGDPVQVFYQVGRSGRIYVASANAVKK